MIRTFVYYLHDDAQADERIEHIEQQIGMTLSDEAREGIGRPFYEVGIGCQIDTETGAVTLLGLRE